jgi:hypothetical protein
MKLLKSKVSLLVGALALTSVAAAAALVSEKSHQKDVERAVRMQILSVVALENNDYATLCQAQRDTAIALEKAHVRGADIHGRMIVNIQEYCNQAGA